MTSNLEDKIPEIGFDIFARFLPGSFILGLYTLPFLNDTSIQGELILPFGFVSAYILGFCIDVISAIFIDKIFLNIILEFVILRFFKKFRYYFNSERDLWNIYKTLSQNSKKLMLKMLGERAFFRSLLFGAIAAYFVPPPICGISHIHVLLAITVFSAGLLFVTWRLSERINELIIQET